MIKEALDFIEQNKRYKSHEYKNISDMDWHNPDVAYIRIKKKFNVSGMLEECQSLDSRFVDHRKGDYAHDGWQGITLHGIADDKTEDFNVYGFKNFEEANYKWTKASEDTPKIKEFVKALPYEFFKRVRIMKLKAGGYIAPHSDGSGRLIGPLNFAINQPENCKMVFEEKGTVPFSPGTGFYIDVGRKHCVVNNSNIDRYHLIIHGRRNKNFFNFLNNIEG